MRERKEEDRESLGRLVSTPLFNESYVTPDNE